MFLYCLCGLGLSGSIAIPAIIAGYGTKELDTYTLAQLVKLFHAFPAIPGNAFCSLDIFWIAYGMYIIYLFSDVISIHNGRPYKLHIMLTTQV